MPKLLAIAVLSFGVWAPNAQRVSIVGDFNQWDGRTHPMRSRGSTGLWELFVPGLGEGAIYKYEIRTRQGGLPFLKADPYGFRAELRPRTGSIVARLDKHKWNDAAWIAARAKHDLLPAALMHRAVAEYPEVAAERIAVAVEDRFHVRTALFFFAFVEKLNV